MTLFQAEMGLQTGQGTPASPGAQAKENETVLLPPTQQGSKTGMLRSFTDKVRVELGLQEGKRHVGRGVGQSPDGKWHK